MSITTKFLVTGMLVSGVCNTILVKFQDMQCVENCDQDAKDRKYFEQPVWQTLNMFIGETLCFIAGYILLAWEYHNGNNGNGDLKKNDDNNNNNTGGYLSLPQENNQVGNDDNI